MANMVIITTMGVTTNHNEKDPPCATSGYRIDNVT